MKKLKFTETNKIIVVFMFALLFVNAKAKPTSNDTVIVKTKKYEGVIWGFHYPLNLKMDTLYRWIPTEEDVAFAENLIEKYVLKMRKRKGLINQGGGCPIIHLNLQNYIRQYLGTINEKGQKILEVNFVWKVGIERNFPYWKTHLVIIIDGCSLYWGIKVNLCEKRCYDYYVDVFIDKKK